MAAQQAGPAGQPGEPGQAPADGPAPGSGGVGYGTGNSGRDWTVSNAWGQAWQVVMTAAVIIFVVGLILLVWPKATVVVVAALIGVALLVTGILRLITGFTAADASGGARAASIIIGLLAILAGLYCLRHLSVTAALLAFVVGVFWTLYGIVDLIAAATSGPGTGRGLRALTGLLSLVAGLVVMFWPTISVTILLAVIGIWLIFYGLLLGVLAWQVRSLARTAAAS